MTRERAFNHFLAAVDDLAGQWGHYTAYPLDDAEHLGTVAFPLGLHDAREFLEANGYERHYVAAAKFHPGPHDAVDHASYRKVPDAHPTGELTKPSGRRPEILSYNVAQCQYHVHLWPTREGIEFYGHYELRGDLHPVEGDCRRARFGWPLEALRRMRRHYRPTRGETYLPGVTDLPIEP